MSILLVRLAAATILGLAFCGCESGQDGAFGAPKTSALLAPFAGKWECDEERTIEAAKATGVTEEELAGFKVLKQLNGVRLHADVELSGNTIQYKSIMSSEYWLFGLHQHGDYVCGKAWHHEDRFDPGDMSKCYVRLKVKDGLLYLETKMKDGLPDDNDPDLLSDPAIEGGSADQCTAAMPPGSDWDAKWQTFVFKRKS